ncbi:MAG: chromosomal replication initiator protein DnaA [Planctomycetaceae bacterium]|nr:MAG: chromosomal replication initiator protein DnaA [Planctomycetaceae bacterium]
MQGTITDGGSRTTGSDVTALTGSLAERIGREKYKIWFQDCTRFVLSDEYLRIGVPNPFLAGWLEGHFLKEIKAAAQSVLGVVPEISFVVDAELSGKRRPSIASPQPQAGPAASAPHAQRRGRAADAASCSPASLRLTLDSFIVGPSNELAYNAARAVVRERQSPYNPLFIHGGCGVGKTHLLQGICSGVAQAKPGARWLYLSAEDFANQFVLALKTKRLEVFRNRMRQTDLLAIDDVHFLASKPSTQEEFLHTFNTISLAGKQVILVSDAHPKMIGQLSDKLVNRFVSGMVVKIEPPDFETRCAICRQYSQRIVSAAGGGGGQPLSEDVIRFVAESVRTNVRELEGALVKLTACAALQGARLTLSMAQAVLAEHIERCDPIIHIADIESTVSAYFGVTPAQLHSSKKSHTISLARHFSMYLTRKHTNMSSSEVGRHMGNKNHATVLVACKKVDEMLACDEEVHWQSPHGNKVARTRAIVAQLEDNISH